MNNFFNIKIFLRLWKIVEVILVLKLGDFEELCDYKFIFFLFVLLKVFECLVYRQFVDFISFKESFKV